MSKQIFDCFFVMAPDCSRECLVANGCLSRLKPCVMNSATTGFLRHQSAKLPKSCEYLNTSMTFQVVVFKAASPGHGHADSNARQTHGDRVVHGQF